MMLLFQGTRCWPFNLEKSVEAHNLFDMTNSRCFFFGDCIHPSGEGQTALFCSISCRKIRCQSRSTAFCSSPRIFRHRHTTLLRPALKFQRRRCYTSVRRWGSPLTVPPFAVLMTPADSRGIRVCPDFLLHHERCRNVDRTIAAFALSCAASRVLESQQ